MGSRHRSPDGGVRRAGGHAGRPAGWRVVPGCGRVSRTRRTDRAAGLRHAGGSGRPVAQPGDDRARRAELLHRPAGDAARHRRHAQLRLARSRRLHGRRHRADDAHRHPRRRRPRERPRRRDDPPAAGRPAARSRSARPAPRGHQRRRHAPRYAGAVRRAGAGAEARLQRRVRRAVALRAGDAPAPQACLPGPAGAGRHPRRLHRDAGRHVARRPGVPDGRTAHLQPRRTAAPPGNATAGGIRGAVGLFRAAQHAARPARHPRSRRLRSRRLLAGAVRPALAHRRPDCHRGAQCDLLRAHRDAERPARPRKALPAGRDPLGSAVRGHRRWQHRATPRVEGDRDRRARPARRS